VVNGDDSDGVYCWTTGDVAIDYDGDTYEPYPVTRGEILQTSEINRQDLRLSIPPDSPLAQTYHAEVPERVVSVTLYRKQDDNVLAWWKGRIAAVMSTRWETVIECENVYTSLRRHGVRARYQRQCRHALYGTACGVSAASFGLGRTVSSVNGSTVTVSGLDAFPAGYFIGGSLQFGGTQRFIVGHAGNVLTLWRPMPDLTGGQVVTVYPGCDRSLTTCNSQFANAENHGGFPWLPNVNPFRFISLW
jgi:uncharacterized phage protein (TIGR02218 family)